MSKGPGTGEFRSVINLKGLNRFLSNEKFKMEELHSARSFLLRLHYIMKLDLKDASVCSPDIPGLKISSFLVQGKNVRVPL